MTWHKMVFVILQICTPSFLLLIQSCTAAQFQTGIPQTANVVAHSNWPAGAVDQLVENCRASAFGIDSKGDRAAVTRACRCFADDVSQSFELEHFEVFEEEIVAAFAREDRFRNCD
jgi:hypothetical protein